MFALLFGVTLSAAKRLIINSFFINCGDSHRKRFVALCGYARCAVGTQSLLIYIILQHNFSIIHRARLVLVVRFFYRSKNKDEK